jgi:polysaccharide export outer membrane protein
MRMFHSRNQTTFLILFVFFSSVMIGQVLEDELQMQQGSETMPRAIDFSKMFEEKEKGREDFDELKRKREAELREKMMEATALEKPIDPDTYIVGPGDIFMFNIWGAMEMQLPLPVSPEGVLSVPSVGDIDIREMTLTGVKQKVLEAAKPFYARSDISLVLTTLQSFRVHVVGEVEFPGTYLANPTERMMDLIAEAGGTTDWANKVSVELRKVTGDTLIFNLTDFELGGDLKGDPYVNGGDVIYVPPISLTADKVFVDGDFKVGGLYQIMASESVHAFLLRIGAFNKNTNPLDVVILRKPGEETKMIKPYLEGNPEGEILQNGDRVLIPSAYVYVQGCVQFPGMYPYVASYTAKDYAGMAGGNYYSGNIKNVKVFQSQTGKMMRGPDAVVAPGDVVDLPRSWNEQMRNWGPILSAIASSVLAAKAIGLIGN